MPTCKKIKNNSHAGRMRFAREAPMVGSYNSRSFGPHTYNFTLAGTEKSEEARVTLEKVYRCLYFFKAF